MTEPRTQAITTAIDAAYREADELDSNHARWVIQYLADRLRIEVNYPPVSEPNNRLREQLAECQAGVERLRSLFDFDCRVIEAEGQNAVEAAGEGVRVELERMKQRRAKPVLRGSGDLPPEKSPGA